MHCTWQAALPLPEPKGFTPEAESYKIQLSFDGRLELHTSLLGVLSFTGCERMCTCGQVIAT